jgi:hypothetical protein
MDLLEEAVKKAANDLAACGDFYRRFLDSEIYVPHGNTPEELKIERGRLSVGAQLKLPSIAVDGLNYVPVFSSLENLSKAITQGMQYIRINARNFLEIVRGAHVVLNPGGYGKNFLPQEIEAMLSGEVFKEDYGQSIRSIKTEKPEQVLLGQPKNYPHKLVDALKSEFLKNAHVERAFLAHGFIPSQGAEPHTIIGIEADDYRTVVNSLEPLLKSVIGKHEIVDFVSIQAGNTIAEYMLKETQPFYVKAKKGFWQRMFGR